MAQGRETAEIGVFGGSGFYSLLDEVREVKVDTPYGPPSDSIFLADVAGRRGAVLPRHGIDAADPAKALVGAGVEREHRPEADRCAERRRGARHRPCPGELLLECRQRLGPPGKAEAGWLVEVLGRWVETGGDPDDDEAARLLLAVGRLDARDAALFAVSRETARDHLRVWSGVLRRAPRDQVPPL